VFDWPPTGALISGPIGLGRFGRRAQLGRRSTLKQVAQASEPCALPSNPICRINRRARCAHLTHCALMDNSLKGPPPQTPNLAPLAFSLPFPLNGFGPNCLPRRSAACSWRRRGRRRSSSSSSAAGRQCLRSNPIARN